MGAYDVGTTWPTIRSWCIGPPINTSWRACFKRQYIRKQRCWGHSEGKPALKADGKAKTQTLYKGHSTFPRFGQSSKAISQEHY